MARFLGDFTAAVEEQRREVDPATFELYDETFTTASSLPGLPYMEFCRAGTSGLDSAEMEGQAAMLEFIRGCIADEDWPRFADLAKRKRISGDGLMELCKALVEQFTGGPTSQPSVSADGQSTTTQSSKADSSSPKAGRGRPVSSVA